MKLDFAQSNVQEMVGMGEAQVSQMKASPLAFDILSKRIYKNKIKAPIQELACNAQDAHAMVGRPDLPIEVKLPNALDTEFYVKDWGPGLSEDEVKNLYMTYFMSTKSESDDYTGAFGLGSKSPFCYVDQFWVTSAQNGVQTTYVAYKNNQGLPCISKVEGSTGVAPDDWQHGLRVGFPAASEDFGRFAEEAANVFRWFDVKPKVLGSYEPLENDFLYEDELFALRANIGHKYYRRVQQASHVRMGLVGYEVDLNQMEKLLSPSAHGLLASGIVIKVPMGAVSVTASREDLEYDPRTVETLRTALQRIADSLLERAFRLIGSDPQQRRLNHFNREWAVFRDTLLQPAWVKDLIDGVYSRLQASDSTLALEQVTDLLTATTLRLPRSVTTTATLTVSVFETNTKRDWIQRTVYEGTVNSVSAGLPLSQGDCAIVVEDVSYAGKRCKAALSQKRYGGLILVSGKDLEQKTALAQSLSTLLFNVPVVKASTLPAVDLPQRLRVAKEATVRQKIDDRLAFFKTMPVVMLTPSSGIGTRMSGVTVTVPLTEALQTTQAYLVANFTSSIVKTPGDLGGMLGFEQAREMVEGIASLHPAFSEAGLGRVMLLSTSQVQKLRANETLVQWDVEAQRLLAQYQSEIETRLSALPAYLPGVRRGSPISRAHAEQPTSVLQQHFSSWVPNVKPEVLRCFVDRLDFELKAVVEHVMAAIGYRIEEDKSYLQPSASEMAGVGLLRLQAFLSPNNNKVLEVSESISYAREVDFHAKVEAQSSFFVTLKDGYGFAQEVTKAPEQHAKTYNALWQLGCTSQQS